ncbi:MAG: DUF3990 domain-containing protein [Treponema sp.]|nr:DUF3990 domain-containing protein [Treponema sp.]
MILFHGSNMEIDKINLNKCRPYKDFGRGFYTTPIREQAAAMARRTVRIYHEGKQCIQFSFHTEKSIEFLKKTGVYYE